MEKHDVQDALGDLLNDARTVLYQSDDTRIIKLVVRLIILLEQSIEAHGR